MSDELKLFKLIVEQDEDEWSCVSEYGWANDDEFIIWVYHFHLDKFIEEMTNIFGHSFFEDGGFNAHIQKDYVCIDLCEILESYVDIEEVFPKDRYRY